MEIWKNGNLEGRKIEKMEIAKNENWFRGKLGKKEIGKFIIRKNDICGKWKLEKILGGK